MGGSRHGWLEARGPSLSLRAAIDDATASCGRSLRPAEVRGWVLRVLEAVVRAYGVPWSVYMDQQGAPEVQR